MATHGGIFVYDYISAKQNLRQDGLVYLRDSKFSNNGVLVWADVTSDPTGAWFLVFTAFPRDTSPYVAEAVGSSLPNPNDTSMRKLSDDNIRRILNNGQKETRTQWFHTSVEFGTVWADGSLTNTSTQYNLFENPLQWSSNSASGGQRFKRKRGIETNYSDWITSANGGCSSAVGGWSNYYEQSCVQSWFAGCEGGPALNHRCAGGVQDRANKLIIWAR
jgi:hypothetical protein